MRRFLQTFITLVALAPSLVLAALPLPEPPEINAKSYLLIDINSGQVLAERNSVKKTEPASITKLMTAYIAFSEIKRGNVKVEDRVLISEKAWRTPGSRMFVEVGKNVPVEALLKGLIIQSGNDAAVALAEHIAGNETTFAAWMNQYAADLGMSQTSYANSTGLPDESHYSSAADIATLARSMIEDFPEFYPLYSQKSYTWNKIKQANRNKLLWRDASVDGLKTGHTESAGYCLVASAERDGMRLVSVVLGSSSESTRARASQALLNYGFRFYETIKLHEAAATVGEANVWKGAQDTVKVGMRDPVFVTIPRGRKDNLKQEPTFMSRAIAPISSGQELGKLRITLDGRLVHEAPLLALTAVPEGSLWKRLSDEARLFFESQ